MEEVMPRQDSTTDQIESVATALDEVLPDAARKIREGNVPSLTDDQFDSASRVAVGLGCYDAHDWLIQRQNIR